MVQQVSLKDFFRNPEKTGFDISPDGLNLAFMAPVNNRLNVFIQKTGEDFYTQLTHETERDLAGFFWVGNNRILFLKDEGGDENFALFGVNIDGSNLIPLTQEPGVRTQMIDSLEEDLEHVIVGLNKRDARVFDAYRLNINTGEQTLIAENPGNISAWMTDNDGKLRLAITTDQTNNSILYREKEEDEFKEVLTTNFKESFAPQFFDYNNKSVVYGTSNIGRDKSALIKYDLAAGKEIEQLFIDEHNDITGVGRSKKRKTITSVYWYGEKLNRHYFDEESKSIFEFLEKALPDVELRISSMNKNEDKMIIRTFSDKSRGAYYFFDKGTQELSLVQEVSPWIDANIMADMTPIEYQSRDGLTIHGYLSLPKGVDPTNLPVVVNVHGGPWARDHWLFNPEVQFLANRGYAVLQMNFRGSTSYGRAFWEASFKQWGQTMQNDVSDGADWLVKQGVADPSRIAIYGGSYGGYATLAGLTYTPDLYCCGVDYVGVSNLFTFMETIPPYWSQYLEMLYEMVGHPEKDKEMLAAFSPSINADKIKAPLFVAQGANDPRVKKSESDQMVEAMRARGVDVEYLVKENEGHGFHNEENRFEFYEAMEKFLASHMQG
jgi:dipeptidyl aminopeptidase/acylaminoacyl peptidase